ncbi:MAG: hypothetical protein M3014_06150, partial [Chloroflexota bacterium]|nr:hypothetical protein [Chloroflexota bacterium]
VRRPAIYMFGAGMAVGLSTLVKPPGVSIIPALTVGLLLLLGSKSRAPLLYLGAGAALPIALSVVPYFFNPPALEALRFSFGTVLPAYTSYGGYEPISTRAINLLASMGLPILPLLATALVLFIPRIYNRTWGPISVEAYSATNLLAGVFLFTGNVTGKSYDHYLIVVLPFLLLFAGHNLITFAHNMKSPKLRLAVVVLLVLWLLFSETGSFRFYTRMFTDDGRNYAAQAPLVDTRRLADYIKLNSNPSDRLWVYYNAPELYWLADRQPATTDPTASWLSDQYNQLWFSKTALELQRARPAIIIGLRQPRFPTPKARRLEDIPEIKDLLAGFYTCDSTMILNATLCKHR